MSSPMTHMSIVSFDHKAIMVGGIRDNQGVTELYEVQCETDLQCTTVKMDRELQYPRINGAALLVANSYC